MNALQKIVRNSLWQALSLLPKDPRKAVCQSFYGRGYSDSPAAIATELLGRGWKVYWTVAGPGDAASLPKGIVPILADSPEAVYHMCTAGVWVDNCRKWAYTQKRGATRYIQTWHGFPLKRIEGDAEAALPEDYLRAAKKDSMMCDLFLSNSAFLTEIYRRAFWYGGEVLECGFPRNDILFGPEESVAAKVRHGLKIKGDKRLALYAPTFRKDKGLSAYDMDYARVAAALGRRFGGEWLIVAKLHPNIAKKAEEMRLDPAVVVNGSDYADIQELYVACGALVTDYSSVMFDYMNTGKPVFLYVNDLEAYRNDRNFYFDLDRLPFDRAEDQEKLEGIILGYDQKRQGERIQAFCKEFGVKEDGRGAKRVADWLEDAERR